MKAPWSASAVSRSGRFHAVNLCMAVARSTCATIASGIEAPPASAPESPAATDARQSVSRPMLTAAFIASHATPFVILKMQTALVTTSLAKLWAYAMPRPL